MKGPISHQQPSTVSGEAHVLFPLVTMLLGAWLADEPVTVHGVVGALLVMAGVWFGAVSPAARRSAVRAPLEEAPPILESR